jgi:hypothetical protein
MIDPLEGVKLKIERANSHITDVSDRIDAFLFRTKFHELITEVDSKTGQQLLKIRIIKQPPREISVISGEILYGLRSALDHLVTCVATRRNYLIIEKTGFPIETCRKEFERILKKRKIQQRIPALAKILTDLKPYEGGNVLLWWLHWLNAIDKHKILVTVAAANIGWAHQLTFKSSAEPGTKHLFHVPNQWQRLDKESIALIYPASLKMQTGSNVQLQMAVIFGDIQATEPYTVTETLVKFVDLTRGIVKIFEDRFFKP